jgi:hypothetical protein
MACDRNGKDHLRQIGTDIIILKLILKKRFMGMWNGFISFGRDVYVEPLRY